MPHNHSPITDRTASGPVFHWFLPTRGDSDTPGQVPAFGDTLVQDGRRPATLDYLTRVARAAEDAGFHSVLTPVGLGCPDPWVLCSAIAARTQSLGFIVAIRPSLASPTLLAQQADTFTGLHGPRLIGTALVGSHDEVAERLTEYADIGIDEFILSGYPHLEEASRVGAEVIPRVRARQLAAASA